MDTDDKRAPRASRPGTKPGAAPQPADVPQNQPAREDEAKREPMAHDITGDMDFGVEGGQGSQGRRPGLP